VDSIAPIEQSGNEAQAGEEVAGEFVIACGDGAEVLEPAVGALDEVAPLVAFCIERKLRLRFDLLGITAMVPRLSSRARR
jgi:hypothetical protein